MATKWTEQEIRKEIVRLDAKTGLEGAKLPISFNNAKRTLGLYYHTGGGSFQFSNHYYQDPEWPDEEALDTIRHEYAHYMDDMLYGGHGHGATWKHCCVMVGAIPVRCYDKKRADYYRQMHAEEARLAKQYDSYAAGDRIDHPRFGVGTIEEITGESNNRCATVNFHVVGSKRLGLAWIDKNCRRCL